MQNNIRNGGSSSSTTMGHHYCCKQRKVKRGLWSPEEDEKLVNYISSNGYGCWSKVPELAGLQRCGKSCRLRWLNYLRPDIKRGGFSAEEEKLIISLHAVVGNRWAHIAKYLPGRTDNEIKNYWNSWIKKKIEKPDLIPSSPSSATVTTTTTNTSNSNIEIPQMSFSSISQQDFDNINNQDLITKQSILVQDMMLYPSSSSSSCTQFMFDTSSLLPYGISTTTTTTTTSEYNNAKNDIFQQSTSMGLINSSSTWTTLDHPSQVLLQSPVSFMESNYQHPFTIIDQNNLQVPIEPQCSRIIDHEEIGGELALECFQSQQDLTDELLHYQQQNSNFNFWESVDRHQGVEGFAAPSSNSNVGDDHILSSFPSSM